MENIGVFDFLGFELASLVAAQYDNSRSKLPPVAAAANKTTKSGSKMGDAAVYVTLFKSFVGIGMLGKSWGIALGGLKNANRRFEAIRGNRSHVLKIAFFSWSRFARIDSRESRRGGGVQEGEGPGGCLRRIGEFLGVGGALNFFLRARNVHQD